VITVSGAGGGVGKTLLIERLLAALPDAAAVKVQPRPRGIPELVEEEDPRLHPGKDTGRYLAAGARRAYLLSGPPGELLPLALRIVEQAGTGTVIFETNSLAAALEPDLAFFVEGEGVAKPGSERCRQMADVLVARVAARGQEGRRSE